jgi:hypothetical protein
MIMPKRIRYTPIPPQERYASLKYWSAPVLAFVALTLFDVLIGGAIAALLQLEGFTAIDQRLNEVYQLGYAIVIAAALAWLYWLTRRWAHVLALGILFVGYVEDTLFYALMPLCNPVIALLTQGASYQVKGGAFFPASISGWTGWASRRWLGENAAFTMENVWLINAVALALALLLLWRGKGRSGSPRL